MVSDLDFSPFFLIGVKVEDLENGVGEEDGMHDDNNDKAGLGCCCQTLPKLLKVNMTINEIMLFA